MEVLIFYADKLMVMGNSKNLCVFNFVILLKSRKFDAREIYMFYSMAVDEFFNLHTQKLAIMPTKTSSLPLSHTTGTFNGTEIYVLR